MASAPVLDLRAITPEMYRSVGLNPNHPGFERNLGDIGNIPVTQEQREKLGRIRQKRLRIIKIATVITIILCIPTITVGIITKTVSTNFPYVMGGGIIAGSVGLLLSSMAICIAYEGQKSPTGDRPTPCLTNLVKCHLICTFLLLQLLLSSLGLAGIWGFIECAKRKPEYQIDRRWNFNKCEPNSETLYVLSLLTLVLISTLLILLLVLCCSYCTNLRAFGVKSSHEMLLDLQTARMMEMHQYHQQQQALMPMAPAGSYQQGQYYPQGQNYQQGQGYQYVPQGYQSVPQSQGYPYGYQGQSAYNQQVPRGANPYLAPSPTAPPTEDDVKEEAKPPPSYYEVMEMS